MTIDKIKHHMNPQIFEFWTSQTDKAQIEKAQKQLSYEIKAGILKGVKYDAELELLSHLLS